MKPVWFMSGALVMAMGCSTGTSGSDKPAQSAAPPASGAAAANVPELVPGVGIGPVRIGMTRAELDRLGLPTKPGPMGNDVTVGPYTASMDGDRVGAVFLELSKVPSGARVGGTVFDAHAKIDAVAAKLRDCGAMQVNEGANVISCEGGRAVVIAGGPPGLISLHAVSPQRAARERERASGAPPEGGGAEATWKHPSMNLSFSYPDKLLKPAMKPDGATLTSEILGTIEDRSGQGKDKPSPFTITISVRNGKLLDVMKSSGYVQPSLFFPGGTEASFKEEKGGSERITVAGAPGYRIQSGSHDAQNHFIYAALKAPWTLEIVCAYVGDMAKPKVPQATQERACERVVQTLSIKP